MIRTRNRRLVIPAVTVALGSAMAVGAWIGSGWGAALSIEIVTVGGAVAYFVLGGRDTDVGAMLGARPDERQTSIGMRSTALTGLVLILVAVGGLVITMALRRPAWPFLLFSVVGGITYLAGLVVYRDR